MKCIAVIPARGGSKGIPLKNITDLAGQPLISYTIKAARMSRIFDKIIVSTENRKIEKISKKYQAFVFKRPKKLAKDTTSTEEVVLDVLEQLAKNESYNPDIIILLQPTSPLRNGTDIKRAYKKFLREKKDSLLSVSKKINFIWVKDRQGFKSKNYNYLKRPRRQEVRDQFRENGAIYITKYKIFMKYKNRLGGKIGYYTMDENKSIEIDSGLDLLIAGQILKRRISAKNC